jgi:hypothetical protein
MLKKRCAVRVALLVMTGRPTPITCPLDRVAINLAPTPHAVGDEEDSPPIITHKHAESVGKEDSIVLKNI